MSENKENQQKVKKELTKIDSIKLELQKHYFKTIQNYLEDEKTALKFMSSIMYVLQKTPKLQDVDKQSLFDAIIQSAELKLFPGVSGEVYILPYKNKANFILGYQGLVTLLYRAGVKSIYSDIVRKNDIVKITGGTNPGIYHEIALGDRGEAIGAYVVVNINGEKIWKYMNKEEILKFKEFSQSKNSEYSPWNEKNDPELNMWKKTVLRQVAKMLPKNADVVIALEKDNEDGDIKEFIKEQMKKANTSNGVDITSIIEEEENKD